MIVMYICIVDSMLSLGYIRHSLIELVYFQIQFIIFSTFSSYSMNTKMQQSTAETASTIIHTHADNIKWHKLLSLLFTSVIGT